MASVASNYLIRVLIVHPNRLFREGLAFVLARQHALAVVADVGCIPEVAEKLDLLRPDVYVVDLCAPGRRGLDDVKEVRRRYETARILMTGLDGNDADVIMCAEAGAGGYLAEDASLDDLLKSVRAVASGEAICSPRVAGLLFSRISQAARDSKARHIPGMPKVTVREREIIALIDAGLSNKEIAVRLRIETQTVKNHVHNILEKFNVDGRRELRRYIKEQGLQVAELEY